jgi:uncharacterized protein (TIGR00106 family)
MLVALSIIPLGRDLHLSDEIARVVNLIDDSGLPYQLTATATLIEGEWDEVMPIVRKCHELMRSMSPHVVTHIKIEDDEGEHQKLTRNVASVLEKSGRPLRVAR